jgi:hypothetical protein
MTVQTIIAIACLGLLLWIEPAAAQITHPEVTQPLTVRRHPSIHLTDDQVRDILERASKLLKDDSNKCNVTFKLDGPVEPFASDRTPKVIRNEGDLNTVHSESGDVKVVETIEFCRRQAEFEGEFVGCSWRRRGLRTMIVTQVDPGLRHILWAHEFGHTRGVPHRIGKEALMTPCTVLGDNVLVNESECRCFRRDQPGRCPGMRDRHPACPADRR